MKTKKITAVLMAAAMAVSMAATTAMSASAEELDTPVQEEIIEAAEASTTDVSINWGSRSTGVDYQLTETVYKLDMSGTSMADSGIVSAYMQKTGGYYIITLNTQAITKTVPLIGTFSANITGITAVGGNSTSFTVTNPSSNVWKIYIPTSSQVLYPSGMPSAYDYALRLTFDTDLPAAIKALIPAMGTPSAFFLFKIGS